VHDGAIPTLGSSDPLALWRVQRFVGMKRSAVSQGARAWKLFILLASPRASPKERNRGRTGTAAVLTD
jgi:hypothetical protein